MSVLLEMNSIYFNSKTFKIGFQGLSNLMGGAEFDYMSGRFPQQVMKDLFVRLKSCDRETFLEWLQFLQPIKKWTPKKLAYWFTPDGEPIRGILAQFTDEADAELPADIPAGIRKRTCSCIADWMDESGIELLDEDEDRLEMAACKLVHHCVAVIEDEENGIRRDS